MKVTALRQISMLATTLSTRSQPSQLRRDNRLFLTFCKKSRFGCGGDAKITGRFQSSDAVMSHYGVPRIYPLDLSVWKILTYDVVMEELYLI